MTSGLKAIVIRADAGERIGSGHLMRCLALAQAAQDAGVQPVFVVRELPEALAQRLREEKMEVRLIGGGDDVALTIAVARECGAHWVVLDGYQFGAEHQKAIRAAGLGVLVLDDFGHAGEYSADFILNQNIGANEQLYARREPATRLLLGTQFALLRREFLSLPPVRPIEPIARRVLVTFGGADPKDWTRETVMALRDLDIELLVIVGPANPRAVELEALGGTGRAQIRVLRNPPNMPELLQWADIAVSAAGSTCWELALLGVPAILLVLAENQRGNAEGLAAQGMARLALSPKGVPNILIPLLHDSASRAAMSECGRKLVDGTGARRVLAALRSAGIRLRPAQMEDAKLLWNWANDPAVRAVSFQSEPIPWEAHQAWLQGRLGTEEHRIFIAHDDVGAPFGLARFAVSEDSAVISTSVDESHRGRGYGAALIERACEQCFEETPVRTISALIKKSNRASLSAFQRAGFIWSRDLTMSGQDACEYLLTKPF